MTSRRKLYIAGYAAFPGSPVDDALRAEGYETRLTPGLGGSDSGAHKTATPAGLAAPATPVPPMGPPLIAAMDAAGGEVRPQAFLDQIEVWRAAGLCIGFTNGCFDILHPGHMALFRAARAASDRLVVGLNTDASVRRLKGPSRPVNEEHARTIALAALPEVDAVVTFAADTPLTLIEALRPDLLIKGGDYTRDAVVGADVVEARGGRVLLVDLQPGHSTTSLIANMGGE